MKPLQVTAAQSNSTARSQENLHEKHRSTTNKNLLQINCVGFFPHCLSSGYTTRQCLVGSTTPRRRKIWRGHSLQLLLWALQKLNLPGGWIFPGMGCGLGVGAGEHRNCSPGSETNKIILVKETIKTEGLKAKRENSQGPECPIP